jgi:hypothetical protein
MIAERIVSIDQASTELFQARKIDQIGRVAVEQVHRVHTKGKFNS